MKYELFFCCFFAIKKSNFNSFYKVVSIFIQVFNSYLRLPTQIKEYFLILGALELYNRRYIAMS